MAENGARSSLGEATDWVSSALNGSGTWALRNRIPYILGLMMLFDSWDSVVVAFTLPVIAPEWGLSQIESGWLLSSGYGGQFLGAIFFGMLAERLGRKPVIIPLIIIMSVLAVACAFAQNYTQMIILRFVQGIAIGGVLPVTICYVNEVAPTATRGKFFGTFQFIMLSGFGLASIASVYVVPELGWRVMFGIGVIPLFFVPFLLKLPESPRWLAGRGRAQDARNSLEKLGAKEEIYSALSPDKDTTKPLAQAKISELFSSGLIKKTLTILTLWFLTSLVSYGLLNWIPTIYVEMFDIPVQRALFYSSLVSVSIFILPMILRQTIDRIGRRPPVIFGTCVGGIALLSLLLVPRDGIGLVVSMVILGQIGITVGSMILWPYTAEAFGTRVRALALGLSSSTARAASMLTPLLVGGIMQTTGSVTLVFAIFGSLALTVALLWWRGTKETAGQEMGA